MLERAQVMDDGLTSDALRAAFGRFPTGVTLVTAPSDIGPLGFTANSFSSVSLSPPLVQWSLATTSRRHDAFAHAPRFAVHILAADQINVARAFARDGTAFDQAKWTRDAAGVPRVAGCAARLDCKHYATYPAGDHTLILGEVIGLDINSADSLVFQGGRFGTMRYSDPGTAG